MNDCRTVGWMVVRCTQVVPHEVLPSWIRALGGAIRFHQESIGHVSLPPVSIENRGFRTFTLAE